MSKASARHKNQGKNNRGFATKLAEEKQQRRDENELRHQKNEAERQRLQVERQTYTVTKTVIDSKGRPTTIKVTKYESPSRALRRHRRRQLELKQGGQAKKAGHTPTHAVTDEIRLIDDETVNKLSKAGLIEARDAAWPKPADLPFIG